VVQWFNSQALRVPFASITGTKSYLTINDRDHGVARTIYAVQTGYGGPCFDTHGLI
jgi:hypothetical protein